MTDRDEAEAVVDGLTELAAGDLVWFDGLKAVIRHNLDTGYLIQIEGPGHYVCYNYVHERARLRRRYD